MRRRLYVFAIYSGFFILAVILGAVKVISDGWMLWMLIPYILLLGWNMLPMLVATTKEPEMCGRGEAQKSLAEKKYREEKKKLDLERSKPRVETRAAGLTSDPRAEGVEQDGAP